MNAARSQASFFLWLISWQTVCMPTRVDRLWHCERSNRACPSYDCHLTRPESEATEHHRSQSAVSRDSTEASAVSSRTDCEIRVSWRNRKCAEKSRWLAHVAHGMGRGYLKFGNRRQVARGMPTTGHRRTDNRKTSALPVYKIWRTVSRATRAYTRPECG